MQKKQEEAALQSVIDEAKARGVDAKTIKAAQKCFERHIPAFISAGGLTAAARLFA